MFLLWLRNQKRLTQAREQGGANEAEDPLLAQTSSHKKMLFLKNEF